MARQLVWSDARVQRLVEQFVPVADEVGRLQRGKDPECELFMGFAEHGHYAGRTQPSNTRQGIYAIADDGELLGAINTRRPQAVLDMLEKALAKWRERSAALASSPLAAESRSASGTASAPASRPIERLERFYPADGLVLRVNSRDLPRPIGSPVGSPVGSPASRPTAQDWRAKAWNQDYAWFKRDEALAFVPEARVGATRRVPEALARRLARCHLVDNVRGQTSALRDKDVQAAWIEARVTAIDDGVLSLELTGEARMERRGDWSISGFGAAAKDQSLGFAGRLTGHAHFDPATGRFVAFEMLAVGERWGATQFNMRADDLERAPIGFFFALAGDAPAERVAPAAFWEYRW